MSKTSIEWTQESWNPVVGCSIVSPGCTNCYAMKMAGRLEKMNRTGGSNSNYVNHYDGTTKKVNGNIVWTGKLARAPEKVLLQPLGRKKPTTYFVNSMSDLFHEDCPDEWIDRVFAVMALSPQHIFQVLTKRAGRMRDYIVSRSKLDERGNPADDIRAIMTAKFSPPGKWASEIPWPLPNVWLGVSTERQLEADERIPLLLDTPAAVRFISAEPLLGPIELWNMDEGVLRGCGVILDGHMTASTPDNPPEGVDTSYPGLDWVIVGGESGPNARPMHPDWPRGLRGQCAAAGVPFFMKQWGSWKPLDQFTEGVINSAGKHAVVREDGRFVIDTAIAYPPRAVFTFNMGKKAAGRLLDGIEHNAMPTVRP